MASILVTGANGFLGAGLVPALVAAGHQVHAVVRSPEHAPAGCRTIITDLARADFPLRLPSRIDAVIHLAQSRHYRDFPAQAADILAVNVQATAMLADYAHRAGATRFIFASSGGVYGSSDARLAETAPVVPLNYYLSSKYAAELLVANYRSLLHTMVLRPFFLYGPGQQGMLVANLLAKVRAGAEVTVEGDPGLAINPLFIEDAVEAVVRCLGFSGSAVINLCGDEVVTMTGLVQMLAGLNAVEPRIRHTPKLPAGDLVGDNSAMKSLLGMAALVTLRSGLRRMIDASPP